jgi:hypothetical protein
MVVGFQSSIAPEFLMPAVYHAGGWVTGNSLQTLAPNVNGVARIKLGGAPGTVFGTSFAMGARPIPLPTSLNADRRRWDDARPVV